MFVFEADVGLTGEQETLLSGFWRQAAQQEAQLFDLVQEGKEDQGGDEATPSLSIVTLSFTVDKQPVDGNLSRYSLHDSHYIVATIGPDCMQGLELEGFHGDAALAVFSHCIGGWEPVDALLVFNMPGEAKYELTSPERVIAHVISMLRYQSK